MIDGAISDFDYCARALFDHCSKSGHRIQEVLVYEITGGGVGIRFTSIAPDDRDLCVTEIVPSMDLLTVLRAGYARAEMLMASFSPKH